MKSKTPEKPKVTPKKLYRTKELHTTKYYSKGTKYLRNKRLRKLTKVKKIEDWKIVNEQILIEILELKNAKQKYWYVNEEFKIANYRY